MYYVRYFVHDHSTTALFGPLFVSVFWLHLFLRKVAILIFEVSIIHSEQFTKYLALNLLNEIIDGVSINKCTFFSIVSVQIKIERKSIIYYQVIGQLLDCIYCWLFLYTRVNIVSIQIFTVYVHPKIAVIHSIYVYHWNNHKHKHFFQKIWA